MNDEWKKGRGAQVNIPNKFERYKVDQEADYGIDEYGTSDQNTQYIFQKAKSILNKVTSPDIPMLYSLNPYQGCEHRCIYCYARNTHEFWGYSAGTEFEQKVIVKENAVNLLKKEFNKFSWIGESISLSGNTDCYQPIERKVKITREILSLCLEYGNPVGIITKNALILRDKDILQEMSKKNLVKVFTSITALDENLRSKLEPRTTTYRSRIGIIEELSKCDIPCGVMNAPIIPGINDQESSKVLKAAADAGALFAGYTMVRLNGAVGDVFKDWLYKVFSDRADKVWHYIEYTHGGKVSDSRFMTRMKGEGKFADLFAAQFRLLCRRYKLNEKVIELESKHFKRTGDVQQLSLF